MPERARTSQNGFTLIELIGIIVILVILTAFAVTAYQTYVIRKQVDEAINVAASLQGRIADAYLALGYPPANRHEAGILEETDGPQRQYVSQVRVANGRIDVTFGHQAHPDIVGGTISFMPYQAASGAIIWRCGEASPPPNGAVPLAGGIIQSAYLAPTVEARYLPANCRE